MARKKRVALKEIPRAPGPEDYEAVLQEDLHPVIKNLIRDMWAGIPYVAKSPDRYANIAKANKYFLDKDQPYRLRLTERGSGTYTLALVET